MPFKFNPITGALDLVGSSGTMSPLTTKGDIFTYSTVNDRLPVGANGTVLSADSTKSTGLNWVAAGGTGTVTSVAALTIGTTGTDLSSTVADGTTTPVITLQVPTASATNRGALSPTDWSTFNGKQAALTNPITGTGTTNELSYWASASTQGTLPVATYPSLTELSYVKGVTSGIQTQLNNKASTTTASTSGAGLAPQATAPAAGLYNYLGITNGETAYTNKALFDATSPTTQAFSDAAVVGTATVAARRDHKHAMMAAPTSVTGNSGTTTSANGLTTATTTVSISSATAPTNGQVLTATSTTAATWQTPSGSGNMNTATYDPAAIAQQLVGTTATQTLTNKTLTNPVILDGANPFGTFTVPGMSQSKITANTSSVLIVGSASGVSEALRIADGTNTTKLISIGLSTAATGTTMTITSAQTVNRTLTLPDATGTIALTSSSITGNAATATSLTGGAGGSIPYQSSANTTAMLANGSVGQLLRSAGTTAAPVWSTPTYPNTATSGKLLVGDGTNIVLSTPTFPNASATTRKIIVSDGTNWTASTETYAVPGTSGNVMQSNGTNWTSVAITLPTIQKFTSSSGTYTTPAGVTWIKIIMIGAGGGGGGSGTGGGTGGTGGTTTFGTTLLSCVGGAGGAPATANGPTGGTASLGTGPIGIALTGGQGQIGNGAVANGSGGSGAYTPFGGGGSGGNNGNPGFAGVTNTGAGGGGAGAGMGTGNPAAGGASGGFIDAIINSPTTTYSYAIGAAGTAGSAGTSGYAGGVGGSGVIIVEEHYGA
jgi:hypothetical protein